MTTTLKRPPKTERSKRQETPKTPPMPRPEEDDLSTFTGRLGAQVRVHRKRKGLSRHEFAAAVSEVGWKLTETSLRSYENGNRPIPLNLVPFLAEVLGVAVSTLMPKS